MTPSKTPSRPARCSWPFFSAPPATFLGVMGPLMLMMVILASFSGIPSWIRCSAGVLVMISLWTFGRGYLCRIEASPTHVHYRTPLRRRSLAWSEVRGIDAYIPLDRNLKTRYVYITRRDEPPADRREIDADTFQLQDRPGLVEALRDYHRMAIFGTARENDQVADGTPVSAGRRGDHFSSPNLTHGDTRS